MTIGLDAGSLDKRVTLQRPGGGVDDGYTRTEGFADHATVWASVRPGPGTERFANGENAATAPVVVRIRWSENVKGVDPTWRLKFRGRPYDIKSVTEIGNRDGIELLAVARVDQETQS